ncbi:hypothetical protein [Spiroplasma endosymbiont of Dilophus febrilis]|uniref:hypothetical protein n=1 Tax=Spiroplasma endosymbiont of Dilophus febrilis TaxID=3066292 RepID=UPI00313ABA12
MSRKVSNTLIVIIIGFVMFSVTLGLLLSYVNFNPMTYNIKTDNVSCNIKGLEISEQIVNDSIRKENSLLNSDVFQELKIAQQERGAKGETNFVIRNLTKYDVKFLRNCEAVLFKKASLKSTEEFNKVNKSLTNFKSFDALQNDFNNTKLKSSINVDIRWNELLDNLNNSDKIMMKAELLKFYNTFAHYYDKDSILKLLFIII